jgi:hypothetical protein
LRPKLDELDNYRNELEREDHRLKSVHAKKEKELELREQQLEKKKQTDIQIINTLAAEKSEGFPWLAKAYADYFDLRDGSVADYLVRKSHPARKTAEHVREIAAKRRIAERLHRIFKYQLQYYENLFPWLVEFKEEDIDEIIRQVVEKEQTRLDSGTKPDDPIKEYLTSAEYANLSRVEKYQLALDRYWRRKKTKWAIGRDYERYVGYLYENKGCSVYYQGIIHGLADLGRDLIVYCGQKVEVVQCKCWSSHKTIHEKHIFQLFGTVVEYWIKHMEDKEVFQPHLFMELRHDERLKASFITSTCLSEKAKKFAGVLGVTVVENFPFKPYPSVKCNVSRRTGEKIYHLPMDQQYDRTLIEEERHECYVETVAEAENLGFRRAWRWRGSQNTKQDHD